MGLKDEANPPIERVVLVGFMAAGKTAVGAALAARLGWRHLDLDAEIERDQRRTVAEIFAADGEPHFRALEREATARLSGAVRVVISTGGGWGADPSLADALGPGTIRVWLRVTAEEALSRLSAAGEHERRPMLSGGDVGGRVKELLAAREPHYRRAEIHVDTDGRGVDDLAAELERTIRRHPASLA